MSQWEWVGEGIHLRRLAEINLVVAGRTVPVGPTVFLLELGRLSALAVSEASRTGPLNSWGPLGPPRAIAGVYPVWFFRTLLGFFETLPQAGDQNI